MLKKKDFFFPKFKNKKKSFLVTIIKSTFCLRVLPFALNGSVEGLRERERERGGGNAAGVSTLYLNFIQILFLWKGIYFFQKKVLNRMRKNFLSGIKSLIFEKKKRGEEVRGKKGKNGRVDCFI